MADRSKDPTPDTNPLGSDADGPDAPEGPTGDRPEDVRQAVEDVNNSDQPVRRDA